MIEIVISLIISGVCLSTGNIDNQLAITDRRSTKIQTCMGKVIEHIWSPSESLVLAINSHPDYIPSRLPNPVTVVNMNVPLPTHYNRYEVNYVVEAKNSELIKRTIVPISRSPLWNPIESPKGKTVILTTEKELEMIFYSYWHNLFALHVIIVIYDTFKNSPMQVITCNPQAEGNNCGEIPKVFSNFSCDNISLELLKPIRNYNGCPVYLRPSKPTYEFDFNLKRDRVLYNLAADLKRTLNVTLIYVLGDLRRNEKVYRRNDIVIYQWFFGRKEIAKEESIICLRTIFTWAGEPRPTRISPLNTIFLPFTYDLWIAVLFIVILMILIKWMIMKGNGYNNNYVILACAFTDIIGLTFGVCVNRIPDIWSLKLLLGFFLIYVIHIHTAYTSDLVNILTVPRYEGEIRSVEDVAVRGWPIYMHDYNINNYFNNFFDNGSFGGKISKLIIPITVHDRHVVNESNRFLVMDEDGISIPNSQTTYNSRLLRNVKFNIFLTTDISGEIKEIFYLRKNRYFVESLNAVITHLWESGTQEADGNLNPIPGLPVIMKESEFVGASVLDALSQDNIVRPLHLKDLLPIFVILLICLSFCIIIFVAEILIHKIVAHISGNQVVPLNV